MYLIAASAMGHSMPPSQTPGFDIATASVGLTIASTQGLRGAASGAMPEQEFETPDHDRQASPVLAS